MRTIIEFVLESLEVNSLSTSLTKYLRVFYTICALTTQLPKPAGRKATRSTHFYFRAADKSQQLNITNLYSLYG